ncbi:Plant organelle RNA recognition domain-containing protein [Cinnamomum micranthum f. kanehirae]|uniref:Plant organelle RNA recognition domain-containing protein n=1 Tax=Cinnamomum micranthum f. kanehirae TaxID=337451 RepID=A0A3S3N4P5_9MAGN|nr:Plant organelle RNA recognition domain-containing protein [Cinnamomum micranthum f. kanehirae]
MARSSPAQGGPWRPVCHSLSLTCRNPLKFENYRPYSGVLPRREGVLNISPEKAPSLVLSFLQRNNEESLRHSPARGGPRTREPPGTLVGVLGILLFRKARKPLELLVNSKTCLLIPETCLPIYTLSRRWRPLDLGELKVSTFIRQYPTLFQELTRKNSDLLCFQLTEVALKLHQEELQILQQHEMDLILRLRKLLMITVERTLPLQTIDQLKWDMGLPHDYQQTLIPHYPRFFGLVNLSADRIGLKLLDWNNQLAVFELQKNGGGYRSGQVDTEAARTWPFL